MNMLTYRGKLHQELFQDSIELIPIGDMHIGHPATDYKLLGKYVNYIYKKENAYACLMGDEIEAELPSRSGHWGYEQEFGIDRQLEELYKIFKPLANEHKILTKVNSTHTGWTKKLTMHDLDKEIAKNLGAEYLGVGDYWRVKCKEKTYTIYQQHGASSSKYPAYEIAKIFDNYPTADVYLVAHIHQIYTKPHTRKVAFSDKKFDKTFWDIRTGGFVGDKEWAKEKNLPKPNLGAPLIHFNSDKLEIDVKMGL